jgi:23S rRNA pseudouridine1911/1915/1917 synthase
METSKVIPPNSTFSFNVTPDEANIRLDLYLCKQFPSYSRSFIQKMLDQDLIKLNGTVIGKPGVYLKPATVVDVVFPSEKKLTTTRTVNPKLGTKILFEHEHFLIVYKPAGLTVHMPNHESDEATLVDWLITQFPTLRTVGASDRPGIAHRIDKETSGLLVVARNNYSHAIFGELFKTRAIKKTYLALVHGHPPKTGSINFPIRRHPVHRLKMTHLTGITGKVREALTHYTTLEYFNETALVQASPVTGRTHQIRVHFAAISHPLMGDSLYGTKSKLINRHALHAHSIAFEFEGKAYEFTAPLPDDMTQLVAALKK